MPKKSSTVLIKQIAEKAGVSQSTVSLVLNGRGDEMRISKETQQLIHNIATEMDYLPNIYARRLRNASESGHGQIIAVFWSKRLLQSYMAVFFKGAFESIEENHYGVELAVKLFEESHIADHSEYFNTQNYNGIIVNGASEQDIEYLEKLSSNVPIVLTSHGGNVLSTVYVDEYNLGVQCALLFAEAGYKKAGLVLPNKLTMDTNIRNLGFKDTCLEHGIELRKEWEFIADDFDNKANSKEFSEFLKQKELPDCIFVHNSMMALGICDAIRRSKYRVPDDIAILGGGVNHVLNYTNPSISMVGPSLESFGRSAIELIMLMMNKHVASRMNIIVPPLFIFNDSFSPEPKQYL